jgi:hypothetical protein
VVIFADAVNFESRRTTACFISADHCPLDLSSASGSQLHNIDDFGDGWPDPRKPAQDDRIKTSQLDATTMPAL